MDVKITKLKKIVFIMKDLIEHILCYLIDRLTQ